MFIQTMTPTLTNLYTALRAMAFQDPILRKIAEGRLSWADASSEEDERMFEDYTTSGEGAEILASIQHYMDKRAARRAKRQESNDENPFIQPQDMSSMYNSNQIKTLIIRNLPRDVTEHELNAIFEKYGPVNDVYIPKNMDTSSPYYGSIKGFALIKFLSHHDSTHAYLAELNQLFLRGKTIGIEFASKDR